MTPENAPRSRTIADAALVAALIPVAAVTVYFGVVTGVAMVLPVLAISAVFCLLYTLFLVLPFLLLLDRLVTFSSTLCVVLGAVVSSVGPFLMIVWRGGMWSALAEASPFMIPGALAGYVFFRLQNLPPDDESQSAAGENSHA